MIDPNRPIQTTEDPPRSCRLIGVLERVPGTKTLLLELPVRNYSGPDYTNEIEIDLQGRTTRAYATGNALRWINEPKRESGFYPLDSRGAPYGRGMTILSGVFHDYVDTKFAVEIVRTDGKPTEAKIHERP